MDWSTKANIVGGAGTQLRDFSADGRLLVLSSMAIVVGSGGAAAAWLLSRLINFVTQLAYFGTLSVSPVTLASAHLRPVSVLVPVIGCLLVGLMARYGSEKIRGHGIPEAIEAILIGRSRIRPNVAVLKPLSSAISIGTGGPFGAEGPIIMTGAALGSLFAQLFHLSNAERKTLLVAGASAGMSATFGTPIAAILLAVELLLFEWKPRSFVPVAVAAIVAALWRAWALGTAPLFPLVTDWFAQSQLLACVALGVLAGLASGLLTAMVYGCEDLFQRLPVHWMWWPMLGGVAIGIGGLIEPRALGVGYDSIAALLSGSITAMSALRLLAVKSAIWSIALGSGTSGGVLAPLLIMGGIVGNLFGSVAFAHAGGTWALVGMAAMMSGTMRAPLTSMMFGLELTHDFDAILPLAIACAAAHATTVLLLKRSILTEKVARRGHHIVREYAVDPFEVTRVIDIMAHPAEVLPCNHTLREVIEFFAAQDRERHKAYPVVDTHGRLVGVVSRSDAELWETTASDPGTPLSELLADREPVVGFEDELAAQLADRMWATGRGRVPILRRDGTVIGMVARRDLLRVRARVLHHEQEREALLGRGSRSLRA